MSGPYGQLNRNLFGSSLHIKGKLVIDDNFNLTVANATIDNVSITGNLLTDNLSELNGMHGINIVGNINMSNDSIIKTSQISPLILGNVISSTPNTLLTQNIIDLNKVGYGRAHVQSSVNVLSNVLSQIIFDTKTFESPSTSSIGVIHPSGNILTTFQAPSTNTLNTSLPFGNVIVDYKVSLLVNINSANVNDKIIFNVVSNKNNIINEYDYYIPNNLSNTFQSIVLNDIYKITSNTTLDVYAITSDTTTATIVPSSSKSFFCFNIIGVEQ